MPETPTQPGQRVVVAPSGLCCPECGDWLSKEGCQNDLCDYIPARVVERVLRKGPAEWDVRPPELSVGCSYCGAQPGERCHNAYREEVGFHRARSQAVADQRSSA